MNDSSPDLVSVCLVSEVDAGKARHFQIEGVPVAVVRTDEGVFAIKDQCSHADVALSEGEVEGCMIECWLHGSQFDLRTGDPLTLPATSKVPVYQTRVIGEGQDATIEVSRTPMSV